MAAVDAGGTPLEEVTQEDVILDMIRQLKKAVGVLRRVDSMMIAEAEMNAAKHLAEDLLPNPLASKVGTTLQDLERSIQRYEGDGDG